MNNRSQITRLIQSNKKEIKFFIIFILLFVLLQTIHFAVRSRVTPFLVYKLTTSVSSKAINLITPDEKTNYQQEYIVSGSFRLKVARGCEGIEGIFILIAAILAYPVGFKSKFNGLLGGILIIYCFNIARIVGLYYTLKYKPYMFDMMHMYVGQTVIIIIAVIYFVAWLNMITLTHEKTS
jgi:exosortase family protein XrtM